MALFLVLLLRCECWLLRFRKILYVMHLICRAEGTRFRRLTLTTRIAVIKDGNRSSYERTDYADEFRIKRSRRRKAKQKKNKMKTAKKSFCHMPDFVR